MASWFLPVGPSHYIRFYAPPAKYQEVFQDLGLVDDYTGPNQGRGLAGHAQHWAIIRVGGQFGAGPRRSAQLITAIGVITTALAGVIGKNVSGFTVASATLPKSRYRV